MRFTASLACSLGLAAFVGGSVVAVVTACGSDSGAKKGGGGSGSGGFIGGGGNNVGGVSGSCTTNADCTGSQVCDPFAHGCVAPVGACTSHGDCPTASYCDTGSGQCLPATVGNPCASDDNCNATACVGSVCQCVGTVARQEGAGFLDIYLQFDRTSSMGGDCPYVPGSTPPGTSKACYATYALPDYLTTVVPIVPTTFAIQMLSQSTQCDGTAYSTPLAGPTALPLTTSDPIVQAIDAETFAGGIGTDLEGALRGIIAYTTANRVAGHAIIGVLMTDGDPNRCETDISNLAAIIADHLAQTGIKIFVIGMTGATDSNLEELGAAGGAEPHSDYCGSVPAPCHYWNVGDGSADAVESALNAIVAQSTPLPCNYPVSGLTPPTGQSMDYTKVNVTLTQGGGAATVIGQVSNSASCPTTEPAWYYDNPSGPTTINLCQSACDLVTAASGGAQVNVAVGCEDTVIVE